MAISLGTAVRLLKLQTDGSIGEETNIPLDGTDAYMLCPSCSPQHQSKRATLNLNWQKGVFNCPRCRFSGTALDLISFYTKWDKKEVETRVRSGELGNLSEEQTPVVEANTYVAPLQQRSAVYEALHTLLTLSDSHMESLLKRGLSEEEVVRLGYKSTPTLMNPSTLPRRLTTMGFNLHGVPGFGLDAKGDWVLSKMVPGFLIPGRNSMGLIQGEQIRADEPSDTVPKYGYLSSKRLPGGAQASTWCHWAGNEVSAMSKAEDIIIIEGWLKGDICHFITGRNFLCLPGVSAMRKAFPALSEFRKKGLLRDIRIAYDMDAYANKDVARQLVSLFYHLRRLGYNVKILLWEKEFKGLDDYLTGAF